MGQHKTTEDRTRSWACSRRPLISPGHLRLHRLGAEHEPGDRNGDHDQRTERENRVIGKCRPVATSVATRAQRQRRYRAQSSWIGAADAKDGETPPSVEAPAGSADARRSILWEYFGPSVRIQRKKPGHSSRKKSVPISALQRSRSRKREPRPSPTGGISEPSFLSGGMFAEEEWGNKKP
jgi:hypothetical protein